MCWMSSRYAADGTAIKKAVLDVKRHEDENGHSWGYAAITTDGELISRKGVGRAGWGVAIDAPDAVLAIAHTRKATKGTINELNAHPFAIRDEAGETVAYMAHNGTWQDAPLDPDLDRADSWYMARELESRFHAEPEKPWAELILEAGAYIGETMIVIVADPDEPLGGRAFVYSGRYGITEDVREGAVWSSGGWEIPDRYLFEVSAEGNERRFQLLALEDAAYDRIREDARAAARPFKPASQFPNPDGHGYERWFSPGYSYEPEHDPESEVDI